MSEPFFHYIAPSGRASPSTTGTESDWFVDTLEQTNFLQPVLAASNAVSSAGVPSHVLRNGILPWNNFPARIPIQNSTTAAWSTSCPPLPPPSFLEAPVSLDACGSCSHLGHPASFGIDSFFSQLEPCSVTLPTVIERIQNDGGLISAQLSCGFNDNHAANHYRQTPSSSITTPVATDPTLDVETSGYISPIPCRVPNLPLSFDHPTSALLNLPKFNTVPTLTTHKVLDTPTYLSPGPSFFTPAPPPLEASLNQIYSLPNATTPSDPLYIKTVPLEAVRFPPPPFTERSSFFYCQWDGCGTWIMSEDHFIRDHMKHVHNVVKGADGSYRCEWAGCSSSGEWSGLVRHIQTHLHLRWRCSVCEASFARRDSVRSHANKVSECQDAQAVSRPSQLAYRARNNGNGTVTLTKMVRPNARQSHRQRGMVASHSV